jgi:hypothetical protein
MLTVAVVFAAYVLSPVWWPQLGQDSEVFYAAGTLAREGGNPYDPLQMATTEDRLYHSGSTPLADGSTHATYANPPLFTTALAAASRLPLDAFRLATFLLLAAAAAAAVELCLRAARWKERFLARVFLLSSAPAILAVFVGNTSPLLLLAWAAAWLLMSRGLAGSGGAALALLWLKPSVGLLVGAALILAGPGDRRRAAVGFVGSTVALLTADLVTSGVGPFRLWVAALTGYAGSLSTAAGRTAFSGNSGDLAGLPGAFLDHTPTPVAVGLSAVIVGGVLAWALGGGRAGRLVSDPVARLALAMAAALALSPYLHLNDLILEAAPLMVIASVRLNPLARVAFVTWTVGSLVKLILIVVFTSLTQVQLNFSSFGFGVVINAATLLAVAAAVRLRVAGYTEPEAPPGTIGVPAG